MAHHSTEGRKWTGVMTAFADCFNNVSCACLLRIGLYCFFSSLPHLPLVIAENSIFSYPPSPSVIVIYKCNGGGEALRGLWEKAEQGEKQGREGVSRASHQQRKKDRKKKNQEQNRCYLFHQACVSYRKALLCFLIKRT